jgi:hypothetical protein
MLLAPSQRRYEVEWTHILVFIPKVYILFVSRSVGKTKKERKKTSISRTASLAAFEGILRARY